MQQDSASGSCPGGTGFKDYFSDQSQDYNQYRPHYPAELFGYLASISNGHDRAWNCATGSGQSDRQKTAKLAAVFTLVAKQRWALTPRSATNDKE